MESQQAPVITWTRQDSKTRVAFRHVGGPCPEFSVDVKDTHKVKQCPFCGASTVWNAVRGGAW